MSNSIQCDKCGFVFKGHSNSFGKICTKCDNYIEPLNPIKEICENRYKHAQETIKDYLKQSLGEIKNANKREQKES